MKDVHIVKSGNDGFDGRLIKVYKNKEMAMHHVVVSAAYEAGELSSYCVSVTHDGKGRMIKDMYGRCRMEFWYETWVVDNSTPSVG